jgi:hypothetical protein
VERLSAAIDAASGRPPLIDYPLALLYDRALAYLGQQNYAAALRDFNTVLLLIAERARIEQALNEGAVLAQYNIAVTPNARFANTRFISSDEARLRAQIDTHILAEPQLHSALFFDAANLPQLARPELLAFLRATATAESAAASATALAATVHAEITATHITQQTARAQQASATARSAATFVSATQNALVATEAAAATATAQAVPTSTPFPPTSTPRPIVPTPRPAQPPAPTSAPPEESVPIPIIPDG